jgi:DNA-binding NtrC family response regulator
MSHKKFRVLHLEDNLDITDKLKYLFENENIHYEVVQTAEEAYERLDTGQKPHIMLVDLCLEDDINPEPGIQFIKKAYDKYPGLKMMVLSNRGDQTFREDLDPYVFDYEVKIFRPSVFKDRLIERLKQMDITNE